MPGSWWSWGVGQHIKSSAEINKRKHTKITKLASTCIRSKACTYNNPEMIISLSDLSIIKILKNQVSLTYVSLLKNDNTDIA